MGEWADLGNPCLGNGANLTFRSQNTYILPVCGMDGAFIFMADRWNPADLADSRYLWLPIRFKDDVPYLQRADHWDLDMLKSYLFSESL